MNRLQTLALMCLLSASLFAQTTTKRSVFKEGELVRVNKDFETTFKFNKDLKAVTQTIGMVTNHYKILYYAKWRYNDSYHIISENGFSYTLVVNRRKTVFEIFSEDMTTMIRYE